MPTTKLPILRSVTTAYRDTCNAITAMPALAAAALVIILAVSVLDYALPMPTLALISRTLLLAFLIGIARNFFDRAGGDCRASLHRVGRGDDGV
jgi:hypothetical protein